MSREIKFRAWNKNLKSFAPDNCSIQIQGDDAHVSFDFFDGNFDTAVWYLDDVELMQFTGLKDKHGVYVYSGDVIKGRADLGGKLKRFIGVVDIDMPYVTVKGVKQYSWKICQSISDVRLFEVIGNIYETPELLEAKN